MSRPPGSSRDADELLRCADVLGSFGVTAADISRGASDALEDALAATLASGRDRTTVLRRTIAESDRGFSCSARYSRDDLERELTAVFEAVGWSLDVEPDALARDRLTVTGVDPHGRRRAATIEYPDTPLGTDNLPAVLQEVNASLLSGTDAQFVLLSAGVDRWLATLVDETDLEDLRDRYGPRIDVVDRPLLPEHGLEAYVPDEAADSSTADRAAEPWPAWTRDRERDGSRETAGEDRTRGDEVASFIEEAESEPDESVANSGGVQGRDSRADDRPKSADRPRSSDTTDSASASGTSAPSTSAGGFELCGGSPAVSRVRDDESRSSEDGADRGDSTGDTDTGSGTDTRRKRSNGTTRTNHPTATDSGTETSTEGFGTLSGTTTTTRVSNESFGSDVEWESEDDRYRALGAALGAGGDVSVRGFLEDDEFLPELPAAESAETRIEFDDAFDPAAVPEAKAAAEESGFEWVESGSLETTRVSNG